jgi:hypothetical protein
VSSHQRRATISTGTGAIRCWRNRRRVLDIWVSSFAGCRRAHKSGEGSRQRNFRCRHQTQARLRQLDQLRSTIGGLGFRWRKPAASTLSTTLFAPPTVIDNAFAVSSTRHLPVPATTWMISNHASGTVRLLNCDLYTVPQLCLQTDQVTRQSDQLDLHSRTLSKLDSTERSLLGLDRWCASAGAAARGNIGTSGWRRPSNDGTVTGAAPLAFVC